MRRIALFSLPLLLNYAFANAKTQVPAFVLTAQESGDRLRITAVPPDRYHFNLKAPVALTLKKTGRVVSPERAKERELYFEIGTHRQKVVDFTLSLYLCDDAKTICEKQALDAKWNKSTSQLKLLNQ